MAFLNSPSPPLPPPPCADRETTPPTKPVPATETTGCGRTARETTGQIGKPFLPPGRIAPAPATAMPPPCASRLLGSARWHKPSKLRKARVAVQTALDTQCSHPAEQVPGFE